MMLAGVIVASLLCSAVAATESKGGTFRLRKKGVTPNTVSDRYDEVTIENQPVFGYDMVDFGQMDLDQCMSDVETVSATPTVKVCGNDVKMIIFLDGNCGEGSTWEVGTCASSAPPSACQIFNKADDQRIHHARSYKLVHC